MFSIKVSSTSPTLPVPSTRTTASTRFRHKIPKSGLKIHTKSKHKIAKSGLMANGNLVQDALLKFSDWAIVGTTILSVPIVWPLTAVANTLDLDLVAIFKVLPSKSW